LEARPAFPLNGFSLAISVLGGIASVLIGIIYFRSVERQFADVI
jgi:uncharacterized membrane protein YuzA (DUF378 family)